MLERHRRRMDGVIDIVDALGVRRIDAERVRSRPVFAGRDDLALRERGRQASLVRDDGQIVVSSRATGTPSLDRQRVAQPAAEIPPWRADGVSPGCVQRSIEANEPFVFDSVARHAAPLGVQQVRILLQRQGPRPPASAAGLCPNAPAATRARLSTAIRATRVTLPISKSSSDKAMAFRFVHTADVHLDSPLATLALRDPELADLIGGATRKAFVAVIDLCLVGTGRRAHDRRRPLRRRTNVDEDGALSRRPAADGSTRRAFTTFIIRGNHDAESRITRELTLPESVKVFTGRAEAVSLARGGLEVDGAWRQLRAKARARKPPAEVPPAGSWNPSISA